MTITALKSILTGIGGSLILAAFCSTFIPMDKVIFILPLFVAFNGALTGFKLVESLREKITSLFLFPFVMGLGGGAATFAVVNFAVPLVQEPVYLTVFDLLLYTFVSGLTSYLGAKLAYRYFNL